MAGSHVRGGRVGRPERSAPAMLPAAIVAVALSHVPAPAHTWVVREDGTGDAPTIQAAVDSAAVGDTVLVMPGTYTDVVTDSGGELAAAEMKSGVVLRSAEGAGSTVIDVTSAGVARGITCRDCDESTVIEGFTITGGSTFTGAGILIEAGAPSIRANTFADALGGTGGGMRVTNGATPEIVGNLFDGNQACCGIGGAMLVDEGAEPQVIDNVFTGNSGFSGGAIAVQLAGGLFEDNEFTGNTGTDGAALVVRAASPVVRGNVFTGNHSTSGGGAVAFMISGDSLFEGNVVAGNVADGSGGGILVNAASPEIVETTVVGNSALQGGGIYLTGGADVSLERSIVAFSTGDGGIVCGDPGSSLSVACSDVFGNQGDQYGGECTDPTGTSGNISEDPLFCDLLGGDYTLCANSPCLPGNHPDGWECGLIGARGGGCGDCTSPVEEVTWGAIKALYR